jgi:hypothetical protein
MIASSGMGHEIEIKHVLEDRNAFLVQNKITTSWFLYDIFSEKFRFICLGSDWSEFAGDYGIKVKKKKKKK